MFVIICSLSFTQQIQVPRSAVGIVIGKGGDMIKKIQSDTGAKVQFKPGTGDSNFYRVLNFKLTRISGIVNVRK